MDLNIVKKNIEDLKECPYNPRKISMVNQVGLENSIKKFGYLEPIIWNKQTGNIVGGNQRFKILKKNGETEIQVTEVDLSLEDEKALNLALNNAGIQGEFTDNVLDLVKEIKEKNQEMYDKMRLFYLETLQKKEKLAKTGPEDKLIPDMELQPFEHYDYVVILADNLQDWYWLSEFLNLEKVNASSVGGTKIGLGRGIKASKLKELIDAKLSDSNSK